MSSPEWYLDWFNSPYYHLLYNNRNYNEALHFIDNLCEKLHLNPHSKVWDLACGKGRHSIALNNKGLDVIGTDLSENSIDEALKSSTSTLDFYVHDMRKPFRINYFDVTLNLFTSLGYFKNQKDNYLVFNNVHDALKPGGIFVVDFFNTHKVLQSFHDNYTEKRGEIVFNIRKKIIDRSICKRIEFNCNHHDYYFEERVSLLEKTDFEDFAKKSNLMLVEVFGNYNFAPFDVETSDRLILIFKKQ
jgi:SAM-dependent methyltransferase